METARLDTPSDGLNPEQRQAADARERTVAVIAGPGTGKTRTLVDRIARLTGEGTPPPISPPSPSPTKPPASCGSGWKNAWANGRPGP